jgi:hypothetical protein
MIPNFFLTVKLEDLYSLFVYIIFSHRDAIMSELRTNPYLGPMLGYEDVGKLKRSSPFYGSALSSSAGFGTFFQDDDFKELSNSKHFPANFDEK